MTMGQVCPGHFKSCVRRPCRTSAVEMLDNSYIVRRPSPSFIFAHCHSRKRISQMTRRRIVDFKRLLRRAKNPNGCRRLPALASLSMAGSGGL